MKWKRQNKEKKIPGKHILRPALLIVIYQESLARKNKGDVNITGFGEI